MEKAPSSGTKLDRGQFLEVLPKAEGAITVGDDLRAVGSNALICD